MRSGEETPSLGLVTDSQRVEALQQYGHTMAFCSKRPWYLRLVSAI